MPFRVYPAALTLQTSALDSILSLMWVLLCVVVIIVLAYFFTRRVAGRGGGLLGGGGGTDSFKVLTRLPLGREQALVLVQAGERHLLLGVTASEVSLVAELTQEEARTLYSPPPEQGAAPSFSEALRTVLKQKKPR